MSMHGAPSVPVWTGSSTALPAALSTTVLLSLTGGLLSRWRGRAASRGAGYSRWDFGEHRRAAPPCAQVSHTARRQVRDRGAGKAEGRPEAAFAAADPS